MKNTYIILIAVVVIVAGTWLMLGQKKKANAPVVPETNQESSEAGSGVREQAVKEFTATGENFAFLPSTITVQKGDRVKVTFKNTQGFHDFVIDEYGVATRQTNAPTEEVIEFTADKAGTFEYYCSVGQHRAMGMKGTLVVEG